MLSQQDLKQQAADAAVALIRPLLVADAVIGVGTGSTADLFIDGLGRFRGQFRAAVASSERSAARLRGLGIEVLDLNEVASLSVYVDGADEINAKLQMVKGGGGALTREKIVASAARQFICIADASKLVDQFGKFPLPIEVLPIAREVVARAVRKLGGLPVLRAGFVTDNGNQVLDVSGLTILDACLLESTLNSVPGVVTNGLFALRPADVALLATQQGVRQL